MRVLNDFKCTQCEVQNEHFVDSTTKTVSCKSCGGEANRVLTACNFMLDPISGHFPGATDKWAKHHEQAAKKGTDSDYKERRITQ